VASYRYDAFNRRVEKRVGETREETVWSGWQSLETYRDGALASRRTYGLGLDEVVKLEQDRDGDGALDEAQVPLYDTRGNLVALTRGTDGTPVEKYAYSPFGEQRIFVDQTKPRIEQLRREGDRLLLEVSERIQLAALVAAQASGDLTLTHTGTGQAIEVEVVLPVLAGRTGAKRIAIRPTSALEEGAPLHLHLAPGAILDRFQNPLAGAYDRDLTWSALGAEVLEDTAPPELDLVVVHENVLTVGFTEAIAATQAETAITVDGNPVTWTSDEGGYTLHTEPLANGVHRIEIEATLADLASTPLGESFTRTVEINPTGALLYAKPDPREVSSSAASNPYGFQGLPKDPETGFVYARNRYYDPEMGRFISADPLGYVDGGNLYQYGLNDPVNNADPLGLCLGLDPVPCSDYLNEIPGVLAQTAKDAGRVAVKGAKVAAVGVAVVAGAGVVAAASPVVAAASVGGLIVYGAGTAAATRIEAGQTIVQAVGGGAADAVGVSALVAGVADVDIATGERRNLSREERLDQLGTGVGAIATVRAAPRTLSIARTGAETAKVGLGIGTRPGRWQVGEPINSKTAAGTDPSFGAVRNRFWRNRGNSGPETRVNPTTGKAESMELSHEYIPQRWQIFPPWVRNAEWNLRPRWPEDHAAVDWYRWQTLDPVLKANVPEPPKPKL